MAYVREAFLSTASGSERCLVEVDSLGYILKHKQCEDPKCTLHPADNAKVWYASNSWAATLVKASNVSGTAGEIKELNAAIEDIKNPKPKREISPKQDKTVAYADEQTPKPKLAKPKKKTAKKVAGAKKTPKLKTREENEDMAKKDWTCPECDYVNAARYVSCNNCGGAKPSRLRLAAKENLKKAAEAGKRNAKQAAVRAGAAKVMELVNSQIIPGIVSKLASDPETQEKIKAFMAGPLGEGLTGMGVSLLLTAVPGEKMGEAAASLADEIRVASMTKVIANVGDAVLTPVMQIMGLLSGEVMGALSAPSNAGMLEAGKKAAGEVPVTEKQAVPA